MENRDFYAENLPAIHAWLDRFNDKFRTVYRDLPDIRSKQAEASELGLNIPFEVLLDADIINISREVLANALATMQLVVPTLIGEMLRAHWEQTGEPLPLIAP